MSNYNGNLTLKVKVLKDCSDLKSLRNLLHDMTDEDYNGNNGKDYFMKDGKGNLRSELDIVFEKCLNKSMTTKQTIEYILKDNYNNGYYEAYSIKTIVIDNIIIVSLAYTV